MDLEKDSGYTDYEWAIGLNRIGLTLLGIWPEKDETKRKKLLNDIRVIIILNVVIWSCAVPTVHSFLRIWGNIILMIDNLLYTLPLLMSIIKLYILWRKKKVLIPLLEMIKEDWIKFKTEKERNNMIRQANIGRMITIYGYLIMLLSFTIVVILPTFGISCRYLTNITETIKPMPLQTYYIYDTSKSPFYEITYILQGISLVMAGTMYTCTDNLLALLVFHVCAQFENLRENFHFDDCNFESVLLYSIQNHIRLMRTIRIIDSTFNIMLLGAMIYYGIIFSLQGFLLVTMVSYGEDISLFRIIFLIIVIINVFSHMCLYCIVGEFLVIQWDRFYGTICGCKWYKLKPRKAKGLLMVMNYANKPLYLTAGRIFPMSMSTLCNILKTSGSYISVLLAHRE